MDNIDITSSEFTINDISNDIIGGGDDFSVESLYIYIGIVVFFFFVLAFFTEKRKIKYIIATGALVALVLSWGKNFPLVTNFFIDYVPMYNKFRAVSSIQVLAELAIPLLGVLALKELFTSKQSNDRNY